MFTGLITHQAHLIKIEPQIGGQRYWFQVEFALDDVEIGASIAHNGCCLSVVEKTNQTYCVEVSEETLNVTTLGNWDIGQIVNIERSLKYGDEVGGHLVSGHIDDVVEIVSIEPIGDYHRLRLRSRAPHHRFVAHKGSVALDGISLTVNAVDGFDFEVMIIPISWAKTNLSSIKLGDFLNLEIDRLARYSARWQETHDD